MAGRKLLTKSPQGQFQLFPESLERDPLQLSLGGTKENARVAAAEAARKVRAAMMAQPAVLFGGPLGGK